MFFRALTKVYLHGVYSNAIRVERLLNMIVRFVYKFPFHSKTSITSLCKTLNWSKGKNQRLILNIVFTIIANILPI